MKSAGFAALAFLTACAAQPLSSTGEAGPPVDRDTGFLNRTFAHAGEVRRYQVYLPAGYTRDRRWPVILSLHGAGERGTDGLLQTEVGLGSALRRHVERYPAIVVFPQVPPDLRWTGPGADIAMKALEQTEREFSTDPDRVSLTGLSMGGTGAWHVAYRNPDRFAALLVICARLVTAGEAVEPVVPSDAGVVFDALARRLKLTPVWIFHGDKDSIIPVDESRRMSEALRAAGAAVRYSELPGVDHNSWDAAYDSPEVAEWLLSQRRAPRAK